MAAMPGETTSAAADRCFVAADHVQAMTGGLPSSALRSSAIGVNTLPVKANDNVILFMQTDSKAALPLSTLSITTLWCHLSSGRR